MGVDQCVRQRRKTADSSRRAWLLRYFALSRDDKGENESARLKLRPFKTPPTSHHVQDMVASL